MPLSAGFPGPNPDGQDPAGKDVDDSSDRDRPEEVPNLCEIEYVEVAGAVAFQGTTSIFRQTKPELRYAFFF